MEKYNKYCDIISSLIESGLTPVLEQFLLHFISVETALKMCQVVFFVYFPIILPRLENGLCKSGVQ